MQVNNHSVYSYAAGAVKSSGKDMAADRDKAKGKEASPAVGQAEPGYANYTKNGLYQNAAQDETTFPIFNIMSKMEKYQKVLWEHYSKVNEENVRFKDPEQHIHDKYFNKKSPYYVKGLTQMERQICERAELDVLKGIPPALDSDDPVIQEHFGGCNIFIMDMEWNQEVRGQMDDAIRQAFEENGIVIPDGADLKLTVDPYGYQIHASGVDEGLARRIENALNHGKNGYYLYQHITSSNPANYNAKEQPIQYLKGDKEKMVLWHFVNRLTGYDMRELEYRDGKYYTPDGENLWGVLKDEFGKLVEAGREDAAVLGTYRMIYDRIAKEGWGYGTDCDLSIGYKEGSLYDLDTSYGYGPGQTEWQDRVRNWYAGVEAKYVRERAETLEREENTPSPLEMAAQETEEKMEEMYGKGSPWAELKRLFWLGQTTPPDPAVVQKLWQQALEKSKLVFLTDEIIDIRGGHRKVQGFDQRA